MFHKQKKLEAWDTFTLPFRYIASVDLGRNTEYVPTHLGGGSKEPNQLIND